MNHFLATLIQLALFFIVGATGFEFFPLSFGLIKETEITAPTRTANFLTGKNTIVWKLRDHVRPGTKVRVRVKHLRYGAEGQLRLIAFSGLRENYEFPRMVEQSEPYIAASGTEWSTWEFTASNPVLFVGCTWPTEQLPPIAFEQRNWLNSSSFENYAYIGNNQILNGKAVPVRTNLRLERTENFLASPWMWLICLPLLVGSATIIAARNLKFTTRHLIAFTTGVIWAYRLWALNSAPYWSWGSYSLSLIPAWLAWSLVVLTPVAALIVLALPQVTTAARTSPVRFPRLREYADEFGFIAALVFLAVIFRCRPVYGDWVYGFTNHTHAPLTSAWFAAWASFATSSGITWLESLHMQLVSIILIVPFLWLLFRFVKREEDVSRVWPSVFLLLSSSTLLCFFGEIEVYTVPSLAWLAFAASSFAYLDRRIGLTVPTLVSFLAYLSHVPEALFLFPLLFLWIYDFSCRRPGTRTITLRILALGVSALTITILYVAALFWFKFEASTLTMKNATSHWGFEVLWGSFRHSGVVMPFFSLDDTGLTFTRPGPNFPIFSLENLLKVVAFQFHYSMLFFLLPFVLLLREQFRPLREPKIAFLFLSFVVYTIYALIAYVGWLPLIRDWDLFAVYSFIGAFLTWQLLRKDPHRNSYYHAITIVNLAQTLVWIGINHYALSLPVALPW
jgi:hypothetical protein